ncbi:MAG TPA: hypothetical protein VFU89_08780 [Rhabdochlamydiaceae bacterium]|nr:hypothetical protein [Rhabdochlamydiaceae bacterium]
MNSSALMADSKVDQADLSVLLVLGDGEASNEALVFCIEAVTRTIDSILEGRYSDFDAHTVSNCCHGMSIMTCRLIALVLEHDLRGIRAGGEKGWENWRIPGALVELTKLYLLAFIKEVDIRNGTRTNARKLRLISPLGNQTCVKLIKKLQKQFSNAVANSYYSYVEELKPSMAVSGAPVAMWGRYVHPEELRMDQRGIQYASNLFSMQVLLAYLIQTKSKIAVIDDLMGSNEEKRGRYVRILQGDGKKEMKKLTKAQMEALKFHPEEPVVVFGGCAYSDHLTLSSLSLRLKPWINQFTSLVLTCDIFYPQFPEVKDDVDFDRGSIVPKEKLLRTIISKHSLPEGFSAENPSLFCLSHIYPASLGQIFEVMQGKETLPYSFIPHKKLSMQVF